MISPSSFLFASQRRDAVLAAILGISWHHLYFKRGEHHVDAPKIMWLHALLFVLLIYAKISSEHSTWQGFFAAIRIFGSYATALLTSMVIYRVWFHRLRKFPGPRFATVSKLWHMCHTFTCQNHLLLDKLYNQYGDFVRTGPTEITIFKPDVIWAVDGPGNKSTKAVWYDLLLPLVALNTCRNKQDHDQRRRAWDRAVNMKLMSGYEKRIQSHVSALDQHLAKAAGQAVDFTELIYFLAFDVMGDFAFAKSFNMLQNREWHYAPILLRRALRLLGPISSVPWLAHIAFSLPIIPIIRDWNRMIQWCTDRMTEQVLHPAPENKNIASHLIEYSREANTLKDDIPWLSGDSVAMIIAGSDTVASTLVNLFYRMALHPEHAEKIRAEIRSAHSIYDSQALQEMVHLDACINEVLRLHPSVPTGGTRETPAEGLEIGGVYIPGNITVVAPRYTMGRLETSYKLAEEFIPERWYSRTELVVERKYFAPFSIGRYSCVGRKLALAEIRFTTVLLLSKYDVTFAPHERGIRVWKYMEDQFTAVPGKLELVFTPRKL